MDWPNTAAGTVGLPYLAIHNVFEIVRLGAVWSTTTAWPTANKAVFVPYAVSAPILITRLGWTNGGTVSGNADVGIYDSTGKRIVSAGTTAQAGTNTIQIVDTTDVTLLPGLYYLAAALDNGTGMFHTANLSVTMGRAVGVYEMATAFPLPATATFATYSIAAVPKMIATRAATI